MTDASPFLQLHAIGKRFPGVIALNDVGLDVIPGEVHALLGENGAGKSTLIKVISGVYRPDAGTIQVDGRLVDIRTPHDAQALGISTIYQEFTLAPDMTVAENIFLGREPLRVRALSIIDRKALIRQTRDVLRSLDLQIDPEATVKHLGVAQQQMIEIAKALSLDARLIIMDEPTATLTSHEIDRLFEAIARLKQRKVAVIYVSHRLDEVKAVCDRATILRDGTFVATVPVGSTTIDEMIRLMVGRDLKDKFPKIKSAPREEVLRVEQLTRKGELHGVSFNVRRGEIVGIAGLVGSKRRRRSRMRAAPDRKRAGATCCWPATGRQQGCPQRSRVRSAPVIAPLRLSAAGWRPRHDPGIHREGADVVAAAGAAEIEHRGHAGAAAMPAARRALGVRARGGCDDSCGIRAASPLSWRADRQGA
jgi:ribose transport system ATP-binding protein